MLCIINKHIRKILVPLKHAARQFAENPFIADDNGNYLHPWKHFLCYLSEYIDRPLASDMPFLLETVRLVSVHTDPLS